MLKKGLILLLAVALLGLFAVNTVAATKKVEVTFWHAMTRANLDTLTALANEFMADHPNIQINLAYQGGYGDLSTKLLAAIMAGNPPVMAQMYEDWTMKFLEADALMPLGDQLSPATIVDIPQSLIESNTYLVNGKKALMTVPFNKSAMVLFYNTDLMKQPPKTWDELLQVSKDLTVVKGDTTVQYGFGIRPYTEFFIQFFHQAGGKIFNEDMNKCLINSEAGIQAMNYLLQLKPYSLYQSAYLSDPFGAGKVAMYIGSSAGITFVASASKGKHGWMTADLPAGSINGESMIQGTNIGVFKIGTTQVQRAAAVEFVRFLLSQKATIEWAEGTGYLPVLKSAAASDAWQKYVATHPDRKATTNMILKGFVYPHQANMYNIRSEIETAFEQVMLGKATPKAALDAAAQKIDSEYLSH